MLGVTKNSQSLRQVATRNWESQIKMFGMSLNPGCQKVTVKIITNVRFVNHRSIVKGL